MFQSQRLRGYLTPKLAVIAAGTVGLVAAGMVGAGPAYAGQAETNAEVSAYCAQYS